VWHTHAITRSPAAAKHQKPSGATKHSKRDGAWPSRVAKGVKNTLASEDHVPITDELFSRSKWRLNQRTAASKAGGRVSTRGWQNSANLASKIKKKLKHCQALLLATQAADSPPPEPFCSVFLPKSKKNKKTNLHSPKKLGGLKPPLKTKV
jgi:hypothetical protein